MIRKKQIRVLIADDHLVVRRGLATLIEDSPEMCLVGEVNNGKEAVDLYIRHRPDILLLDLRMPEMDGLVAITAVRTHYPGARILVLTTYDNDEDIYRAFQAGANAYLLKDVAAEELIETIRAVHAGQTRIPPLIAAKLARRMREPELTQRETELLRLLVAGRSNKQIQETLFISSNTVKTHIRNIMSKINAECRTQLVNISLKRGLVRI